jgi:hypothetical protein
MINSNELNQDTTNPIADASALPQAAAAGGKKNKNKNATPPAPATVAATNDGSSVPADSSEASNSTSNASNDTTLPTASIPKTESEFDKYCQQRFLEINSTFMQINKDMGGVEANLRALSNVQSDLENLQMQMNNFDAGLYDAEGKNRLTVIETQITELSRAVSATSSANAKQIKRLKRVIVEKTVKLDEANVIVGTDASDEAKKKAESDVVTLQADIDQAAREILAVTVEQNKGVAAHKLPEQTIRNLQTQITNMMRSARQAKKPANNSWSFKKLWTTDASEKALTSVKNLANNVAFSQTDTQSDAELKIKTDILQLMAHATFALSQFAEITEVKSNTTPSETGVENPVQQQPNAPHTPMRRSGTGTAADFAKASTPGGVKITETNNTVNRAIISVISHDLAEMKKTANVNIGSANDNLQFWGKVLMTLALAIGVIIAAIALVSALGFATPAVLMPYLAAIQANAVINTVLTYVATALSLEMSAAAQVVAVAAAGTLGLFGKTMHYAGAPNALRSDFDNAANDLEGALKETPAARM